MKKFFLITVLLISGCSWPTNNYTREVRSYMPEIPVTDRPVLEEPNAEDIAKFMELPESSRKKFISNNDKLMLYSKKLENKIETYNEFAKSANKASNEALGIKLIEGDK